MINFPAFVISQRFGDGASIMAAVHRHVMFVAVLAYVLQQRLKSRDLHHAIAAKTLSLSEVISPSPQ